MGLWRSLSGMLEVKLVCADPSYALTQIESQGITLYRVNAVDDFTVSFCINRRQLHLLKTVADKRGFQLRIISHNGLYWLLPRLLHRPVLLTGLLLMLMIGLYLPTRVLFIRVEGNSSVPSRLILETAADCGIGFGASRAEVRSEKMKNTLLEKMPQLQWAGINTSGCTAVISVRERQLTQEVPSPQGVASIVAIRDGVVSSVTATSGNPLCKPGQAVKVGQTLISGYTDCGFTIKAVRAEGEVYAQTERNLTVITPSNYTNRTGGSVTEKKYSLLIGKKRINLYFGSGISDSSCVKMYEENYLTLPGGFQLPVAIVTEVITKYDDADVGNYQFDEGRLSTAATRYLTGEMTAGQILHANETVSAEDGYYLLEGRYACMEMIGQIREEEIIKPDGTND